MGRREEALKQYEEAREIQVALAKAHPDVPHYRAELAATHFKLGNLLRTLRKRKEAL